VLGWELERERERERDKKNIYNYIYIYRRDAKKTHCDALGGGIILFHFSRGFLSLIFSSFCCNILKYVTFVIDSGTCEIKRNMFAVIALVQCRVVPIYAYRILQFIGSCSQLRAAFTVV